VFCWLEVDFKEYNKIIGSVEEKVNRQEWEESLTDRGIVTHAITFSGDDECGSAQEHVAELIDIVEDFKTDTREDKINIVTP
jgi:hypothetical protein